MKGGPAGGSGEGIYLLRLRAARGLQPEYLKARPTSFVCSLIHAAQMLPQVPCARSTVGLYRRCAHCPLIGSLVYLYCRLCTHAPRGWWRCQRGVEGGVPRGARRRAHDPRSRSPRSASIDLGMGIACVRASPVSRRFTLHSRLGGNENRIERICFFLVRAMTGAPACPDLRQIKAVCYTVYRLRRIRRSARALPLLGRVAAHGWWAGLWAAEAGPRDKHIWCPSDGVRLQHPI